MERLIAIIGPTAAGKTRLSVDLAKLLRTEIISGDSMLVYQGFDIGTAKPGIDERSTVTHHLIDILKPDEEFSAALFQKLAGELVAKINNKGSVPILAGGTGLYVRSLLEGYRFSQTTGDEVLRREFEEFAKTHGNQKLHALLAEKLPETAARLHPNDTRRIIRALEVYFHSGEKVSQDRLFNGALLYDAAVIGLNMDRVVLYERINRRVDQMVELGLADEVAGLLKAGVSPHCAAMQGIGYKEMAGYLTGEYDFSEAVRRIKLATRRFAKRQLTWYRGMPYVEWFDIEKEEDYGKNLEQIYKLLARKFSIGYNNM